MFRQYLNDLVETGQIPGAVLYISKKNESTFHQSFGSFKDKNNTQKAIYQDTLFDIASLTKVMATLPAILYLASKNELDLDESVTTYLSDFKYTDITISQLLCHTSGLPADLGYRDRMEARDVILEIMNSELLYKPSSKTLYSDLGMILLGKIIERVAGEPLNEFVKQKIFNPWGLYDTTYLLSNEKKAITASTEWYKDSYIQGDVHDEKAFQLGGVSGSAGVFSTASDIAKYTTHWLYPEEQDLIPPEYFKQAIKHRQNNRGLGFEVWSGIGDSLSCGDNWSIGSFGHTGFTGTSVWVDPIQKLQVVFLTNAVHYGRNTNIRSIRKKLHSLIYSSFIEELNI